MRSAWRCSPIAFDKSLECADAHGHDARQACQHGLSGGLRVADLEMHMANSEQDDRGLIVPCSNCEQNNRLAYERLGDPSGDCQTARPTKNGPRRSR